MKKEKNKLQYPAKPVISKKRKLINLLIDAFILVVGNFLYAVSVEMIIVPAGLVTGGVTGVSVMIGKSLGIKTSYLVLAFNIILFILGTLFLGRKFMITTITSTILYPAELFICETFLKDCGIFDSILEDKYLCIVVAGVLIGIAVGFIVRIGASTGGSDIPPLIVTKLTGFPIGTGMLITDALLIAVQIVSYNLKDIAYGVIIVVIYSVIIDKISMMGAGSVQISVLSSHGDEIRKAILTDLDKGVTLLSVTRGMSGEKDKMVMSVIHKRQVSRAKRLIIDIDPNAFIIITRVTEVNGNGFSFHKPDGKPEITDISFSGEPAENK